MWWISTKSSWYPIYLVLIAFLIWRYRWKSIGLILTLAVLITLSDQLSVVCFKEVFHRLRPCHNPAITELVHLVHGKCGGKYGFVSSHAANTFAAASFLHYLFENRYFSISIFIWAAIISYSRIYLGVHYPGDVLGGALLGLGLGYIVSDVYFSVVNIIQDRFSANEK